MKKVIISIALVTVICIGNLLSNDDLPVSDTARKRFDKEFKGAEHVKWRNAGEYAMASFIYNGHSASAYYNSDGDLSGCARTLLPAELPLAVISAVYKKFSEADCTDAMEVVNPEGTFYWITIEASKKLYRIKAGADGNILLVNKK